MKVLFDTSVRQAGKFGKVVLQRQTAMLLGSDYHYYTRHHKLRDKLPEDKEWQQQQFDCLPTVARLAREGKIEPYTSDELQSETFAGQRYSSIHYPEGDVFSNLVFQKAQAPLDRGKFGMSVYEFADIDPDWPVAKKRGRLS